MQTYMWTYADGNSLVSLGTGEIKVVDWDSEEEAKNKGKRNTRGWGKKVKMNQKFDTRQ